MLGGRAGRTYVWVVSAGRTYVRAAVDVEVTAITVGTTSHVGRESQLFLDGLSDGLSLGLPVFPFRGSVGCVCDAGEKCMQQASAPADPPQV